MQVFLLRRGGRDYDDPWRRHYDHDRRSRHHLDDSWRGSTTTSSTTTTIPYAQLLTAENLAACINARGTFYTDHNCHFCVMQKNLFYAETDALVGDGTNVYDNVLNTDVNPASAPCGGGGLIPCWSYPAANKAETGCKTFQQLRDIYSCPLIEVPGHSYKTCV